MPWAIIIIIFVVGIFLDSYFSVQEDMEKEELENRIAKLERERR